ncbi:hypothetical protein KC901_01680 [Patescibacteria group bacterium]|nr:hypothetical protein [Patescibacteria group bacterium]
MEIFQEFLGMLIFIPFSLIFYILSLEKEVSISNCLPKFRFLIQLFVANPVVQYKHIALTTNAARNYFFPPNNYWYGIDWEREIAARKNRYLGWQLTLKIATYIFEWRVQNRIKKSKDYIELTEYAYELMSDLGEDLIFVSSPLFTHPDGVKAGIRVLRKQIIFFAEKRNGLVFNQIPFLNSRLVLLKEYETESKFNLFYKPVIQSKFVSTLFMNEGWVNSNGCKTEKYYAESIGKKIQHKEI